MGAGAIVGVTAIAAGLLAWQLFVPPVVGLANNGDFAKVAGYFSMGADRADDFVHLARAWRVAPEFHWDSGFRTTEHLHVWLAWDKTDIRWVGLTHALVMLGAIAIAASRLGWRALVMVPILLDLAYSAYFNSMYMDAASIVWLSLALAALVTRWWPLYAVASVAFLCSKSTHAVSGLVLCAATLVACDRRWMRWVVVTVQLCAAMWSISRMTPEYRTQAVYNLLFTKLAEHGTDADLLSLGVKPDELRWKGTTAFDPNVPVGDFTGRITHLDFVKLYLRAPWIPLRFVWNDLTVEAPFIRPVHLGNYERSTGKPLGAKAGGPLSWWSFLRSKAMLAVPLFYVAFAWAFARRRDIGMAVLLMGVVEFAIATLGDACETSRHLVLFHYLTDVMVVYAVISARGYTPGIRRAPCCPCSAMSPPALASM